MLKSASAQSDKRSLYLRRRIKFIQEASDEGETAVLPIKSTDNRADPLTKAFGPGFSTLRKQLQNLSTQALEFILDLSRRARA